LITLDLSRDVREKIVIGCDFKGLCSIRIDVELTRTFQSHTFESRHRTGFTGRLAGTFDAGISEIAGIEVNVT
jgi:hypothetical protein